MRLRDKVGIVTGGASGFGRATAVRFAEEGARVVVADVDGAGSAETARLVAAAGTEAEVVVADVSTGEGATAAVVAAVERFGGLDVLVNNAGIAQHAVRDTWDCDESVWDDVLQVNLRSVYVCTPRCGAAHRRARRRCDRERRLDRGVVLRGRRRLRGVKGRDRELHPAGLARAGRPQHPGELRVARLHAHPDVDGGTGRPRPPSSRTRSSRRSPAACP